MRYSLLVFFALFIPAAGCFAQATPYAPSWNSLRHHHTPQWLMDAKFGIYCHWGIQTLAYEPDKAELSNDERIALFKGENFNATAWAELFHSAGAKFGGVIGWHGSPFKHWHTRYSDYNTFDQGPKIDIVGELLAALREQGLRTLVTFHSIRGDGWNKYANEMVNTYDPDLFWVDASFGGTKGGNFRKILRGSKYIGEQEKEYPAFQGKYQRQFISHFYNRARERNKEVEFIYKSFDIPPGVGMRDLENGILPEMAYDVWMTDMDMSVPPDWETHGWFYRASTPLRPTNDLVDMLVDVVSKNGLLLLNIPPKSDGSFPAEVTRTMQQLGEWLSRNGEAIYGTSPWFIYGEGPSEIPANGGSYHHNNHFAQIKYVAADIRFTVKDTNLYATALGKPTTGKLTITALQTGFKVRAGAISRVIHLGSGEMVPFTHGADGLTLDLAGIELEEYANAFRIELE